MSKHTYAFNHNMGDKVTILGTGLPLSARGEQGVTGTVTHCGIDNGGQIYLVRTVDQKGSISTNWFRGAEIAPFIAE